MDNMTHLERCICAATEQGLDPVVDALKAAGLPVEVEQTGGYCMVATVRRGDVVAAVTAEDEAYVVGVYRDGAWEDGEDAAWYALDLPLAAVADEVRRAVG